MRDMSRSSSDLTLNLAQPLKVCLLVGSDHIPHCGVKDYAQRLAEALTVRGVEAEVRAPADWTLRTFMKLRRDLRAARFNLLHIQYPSLGFRYSLLPHLAGLTKIAPYVCVTLHEYSRLPTLQRLSTHLFRLSTQKVFFTTTHERDRFLGAPLGATGVSHDIFPIGSNVPKAPPVPKRDMHVLYFGQIRPGKGLEDFLRLAELSSGQGRAFQFDVLGACPPRHQGYLRALQQRASAGVRWVQDESAEAVAGRMTRAVAAYLPFPDGASYSRGSLLASLINGLPVISSVSAATPAALAEIVLRAGSVEEALFRLDELQRSPEYAAQISALTRIAGARFSWEKIAESHLIAYEALWNHSFGVPAQAGQDALTQRK